MTANEEMLELGATGKVKEGEVDGGDIGSEYTDEDLYLDMEAETY